MSSVALLYGLCLTVRDHSGGVFGQRSLWPYVIGEFRSSSTVESLGLC